MPKTLLVVDDDCELCSMLDGYLQQAGYQGDFENDGISAISRLKSKFYDLLILDVMLPGMSGFDVLRAIRPRFQLPVMILTARNGRTDRVTGLDAGADDYLAKPFYPEELLARIRAILRRGPGAPPSKTFQLGPLVLHAGARQAFYGGQPLNLTAMECEILEVLFQSQGQVVSRDQLSYHFYDHAASPFDRSLDTHISHIRRKLGSGRNLILSVRGAGYCLCNGADVDSYT